MNKNKDFFIKLSNVNLDISNLPKDIDLFIANDYRS